MIKLQYTVMIQEGRSRNNQVNNYIFYVKSLTTSWFGRISFIVVNHNREISFLGHSRSDGRFPRNSWTWQKLTERFELRVRPEIATFSEFLYFVKTFSWRWEMFCCVWLILFDSILFFKLTSMVYVYIVGLHLRFDLFENPID